ncbi:MAG TPA: HAD family hydrolase [Candidatus Acidoferrales bacterium]|nr:HAD family hydrolase [Candidatus Acidoferrales bacterium]
MRRKPPTAPPKNRAAPIPDSLRRRKSTTTSRGPIAKPYPSVIIFDVDGVLVDTRGSFQLTTLQTVKFFTKQRVTLRELHAWKNRPGFNDDWKLSTAWVKALGADFTYEEIKKKFQEIYWGENSLGNVRQEKWLLRKSTLARLSKRTELAIFTGRTWPELNYTLDRNGVRRNFKTIITVEEVARPKPAPDGLLKILNGRPPTEALYVGDNVDDALAAQSADVPFLAILPKTGQERRQRARRLLRLGALAILNDISDMQRWLRRPGTL